MRTPLTTPSAPVIVWFRDDLRLSDHPALHAAVKAGAPVVCLYVLDEAAGRPPGSAARWWLAQSLRALGAEIATRGGSLVLRRGPAAKVVAELARESGARAVHWNGIAQAPHPTSCEFNPLDCVHFTTDGMLRYFNQRYTTPALQSIPRSLVGPRLSLDDAMQRTVERSGLRIRITAHEGHSDEIRVLGAANQQLAFGRQGHAGDGAVAGDQHFIAAHFRRQLGSRVAR